MVPVSPGNPEAAVQFHVIASTGRTATTFLARALDNLDEVAACHEGYRAADKESKPVLPLINLENRQAYYDREAARRVVAAKRSPQVIDELSARVGCQTLIDVAYYYPTISDALLEAHPRARMVAIFRDIEPFVRSATAMNGEDLLPVGWPDPGKELSARERFIEMGRIRPKKGSDDDASWANWSAIMRNIWLWRETNSLLIEAHEKFGDRVLALPFAELSDNPEKFVTRIARHFDIDASGIPAALNDAQDHRNRKPDGYQIGPMDQWTEEEIAFAKAAEATIGTRL